MKSLTAVLSLLTVSVHVYASPNENTPDFDALGWERPVDNPVFTSAYGNNHDSILFVEPEGDYPYFLIIGHDSDAAQLWRSQTFSWNSDDWELVEREFKIGDFYEYDDGVKVDGTYYIYENGQVFTYTGPLEASSGQWKISGSFPKQECDDIGVFYEDGVFHIFGEQGHFPHGPDGTSLAHFTSPTGLGDWTLVNAKAVDPNPGGGDKYGVGDPTIAKIGNDYYIYCDRESEGSPYKVVAWRSSDIYQPFEYIGKAITPRSDEVDDWDNHRIQDPDIAYIPELGGHVMTCNMMDIDGNPGGHFPNMKEDQTRVIGVFYHVDARSKPGIQFTASAQEGRPNIVFLLADDMGYGELGSYDQELIKTPFLDSLASQGMRFTDFYAGSTVCSPSRASLMTGQHTGHTSIRGNKGLYVDGLWDRVPLAKSNITIAEMLNNSGYQTGFIGKWQLGHPDDVSTWAANRGFEYAVQEQWSSPGKDNYEGHSQFINGNEKSILYDYREWDCLDHFRTNLALDYLERLDANEPFFLFMSYRTPHAHESNLRENDMYKEFGWPEIERRHASRITMLDTQIERLYNKLEDMGVLENTVILFTSDNGGHRERGHDHEFFNSNGELKGHKRDLYEGGIRVPFIAYWQGKIEPGSVSDHIGAAWDFMPTIADLAGLDCPPQSDGISILPELLGKPQEDHEYLYWENHYHHATRGGDRRVFRQAIRKGNWKAVRYEVDHPVELYDLSADIAEENDLALQNPDVVNEMEFLFKRTHSGDRHYPYGGPIQIPDTD